MEVAAFPDLNLGVAVQQVNAVRIALRFWQLLWLHVFLSTSHPYNTVRITNTPPYSA
jgi:hypothetical protein